MLIDYALQTTTPADAADTRKFIRKEIRLLRRWLSG
jgi:hypothetical protein